MVRLRCPRICRRSSTGTARSNRLPIDPQAIEIFNKARKGWTDGGGELISFPNEEQAAMMKTLGSVGDDVSKTNPALHEAYDIVTEAAKRTR